jgi:predicted Zn-dependent protease
MTKFAFPLLALLAFSVSAGAQQTSDDPYEFILAKLAADDGRFDEALSRIDKIVEKNPQNAVVLYERALILIDASKVDAAEAELRKVVALQPNFYDAERVLGRVLLDRAANDKTKVDEALVHLQNAFKIYPDDLATGMAISQIYTASGRPAEAEKIIASMLERAPDQRGLNYAYAQVLTKLGRGAEAVKYLERAVEVDPTFGLAIQQPRKRAQVLRRSCKPIRKTRARSTTSPNRSAIWSASTRPTKSTASSSKKRLTIPTSWRDSACRRSAAKSTTTPRRRSARSLPSPTRPRA